MSRLAIVLFISMQIPSVCPADTPDWAGFMGANRDGWVRHFHPPPAWPDQLGQRWQTAVGARNAQRLDTVRSYEVSEDRTWAPPVLLQDGILIKDDEFLTYWWLR